MWNLKDLNVTAGLSVGLIRSLSMGISLFAVANLVFIGGLQPYVLNGAGMFYMGTAILCLFLAIFGKFPSPVATAPVPVLLVMLAIAGSMDLQGHEFFLTFVFSIFGCALLSGLLFLAIGLFRFANFFRFIPYTVSAGTLAGSGVLILLMALKLAGISWQPESWPGLLEPAAFLNAALSLGLGLFFIVVSKIWTRVWVLPLFFVSFCVVFHLIRLLLNFSVEETVAAGLLLDLNWSGALWPAYGPSDIQSVNWGVVASQAVSGAVLFVVLLVLTVVSFAQLELGARMELDWNRELKLHGFANLLSGIGGGIPGATVASATLPNIALRGNYRLTSIVMAFSLVLFTFVGSDLLRMLPLPATSGFLLFMAFPLVNDWLIRSRKRLHITEYLMLVLICIAIVFVGFLEAIALGLVLSLVFFAVRLSQVRLVESEFTIRERRSNQQRSIPEESILSVYGPRVRIFRLRGYIFFGSAYTFTTQLKEALKSEPYPLCVVVDFAGVTGFDLSAVDSLRGYIQSADSGRVRTVFSSASDRFKQETRRDFPQPLYDSVEWLDSEDAALARAEELLLSFYGDEVAADPSLRELVRRSTSQELSTYLERQAEFEDLVGDVGNYCESIEYTDQQEITHEDLSPRGMQLLVSGIASVKSDDGSTLYQLRPGSIIEESSAVEDRNASITTVSEGPCKTILVTPRDLAKLEEEDQTLTSRLFRYILSVGSSARASG
ncbi:MAG: STAS domain-containing protein [Gammaproteobacteria bacterium]|nr:STAS domain-containing protein [Gammaproteobacteria bacterium]MYD79568.1 STAS domain-containing protein [Gammaproteobacteria bacterium]